VALESDPALLAAFRRGEPHALTHVYRLYAPRVLRYLASGFRADGARDARGHVPGGLDVDAAHQETFLRAFRPACRAAYDGVRPYEGLLIAVARTTAIDVLRSAGAVARHAVPLEEARETLHAPAPEAHGPEAQALARELQRQVQGALAVLPLLQRELARLRFMEGLSQVAAAEALGLTRGELRVQESRVRVQLTARFAQGPHAHGRG
jgi:RNA polymerase sigma-70 factor (ECF subfamily)